MKNLKNIFLLVASLLLATSCSEDEKSSSLLQDNVERGLALRTLSSSNTYNFYDTVDSRFTFDVTVEAQGAANGAVLSTIRVYQTFNDNTDDGTDNSKDEVLINTTDASTLETSANGYPEFSLPTLTLQDALNFSGLSSGEYFGLDQFVYRFEADTSDGRTFSTDLGGTVSGGSFFSSPFQYTVTIKCVPVIPFDGDYELKLVDSYGDGWDGAFITVILDGTETEYTAVGGGTNHTVTVPPGTTQLQFFYTPGAFESEHTYTIVDPFGGDAATGGPSPSPGEIFLNICQ